MGYQGDVLDLMIDGDPVSSEALPTVVVNRPCYLANLMNAAVPWKNKHKLNMRKVSVRGGFYPDGKPGGLKWNRDDWYYLGHDSDSMMMGHGMPENEHDLEQNALGNIPVGDVVEIQVSAVDHHPFHMHVNSFQLQGIAALDPAEHPMNTYYETGDWHDVIMAQDGTNSIIRFQTDRFSGEQVIHCHLLEHEDEGMMGWLWITGEDGKEFSESEALEPTCYRPSNDNQPGWSSA